MNYQKTYVDVPTPMMMGQVVTLTVVEPGTYSPARAAVRAGSGPYVSLAPGELRRLAKDAAQAADDLEEMQDAALRQTEAGP